MDNSFLDVEIAVGLLTAPNTLPPVRRIAMKFRNSANPDVPFRLGQRPLWGSKQSSDISKKLRRTTLNRHSIDGRYSQLDATMPVEIHP